MVDPFRDQTIFRRICFNQIAGMPHEGYWYDDPELKHSHHNPTVSTTRRNSTFERERKQSKLMAFHSQAGPKGHSQNAQKILSLELKFSIKIIGIDI